MMQFSTKIPIPKSNHPIDYQSQIVSLGSCFAVNMAEKLEYFKFSNTCNPFGILFHPEAIHEIIRKAVLHSPFTEADIFSHNGLWHSFAVHSDLSHPEKETFLLHLNELLASANNQIQSATHIIITYGTAWVYRENESSRLVANCHKVPQSQFTKELLSPDAIQSAMSQTIGLIQKTNPNCKTIFTVSPVRHIKDGFTENQRSKAHLITAIHNQLQTDCQLTTAYFPSYEIMMDELRDYRFYAEDLLHPNQTAIDYIWERFCESYISEKANPVMETINGIQKALQHKPFHPDSESHQQFLSALQKKILALQQQFPGIHF
ncbi:MAG TPA: GSCFA domain-containing protein [Flavobacterium sp.]|nr:GSCFA domain-containing protein [Flavobacterium sp.]